MCVVAGSWHWVTSWRCPWDSKADGLESSGAHKAAEAPGSICARAWAFRSHSSCCRHKITNLVGSGSSGLCLLDKAFQEPSKVELQEKENKACWLAPVIPMEQWEPWGLHMQVHRFPWHFRIWGSGLCSRGECGVQSSYVCQEVGLTIHVNTMIQEFPKLEPRPISGTR
jgi:hypothetical protein